MTPELAHIKTLSPKLKVGELARVCGKTVRTLRLYEELGLLIPECRSKGGFRLYRNDAVRRVKWIDSMQQLGYTLQEIRELTGEIEDRKTGPQAATKLRELFLAQLNEARANIARLRALEGDLMMSLSYLESCQTCEPATDREVCATCSRPHDVKEAPLLVSGFHTA